MRMPGLSSSTLTPISTSHHRHSRRRVIPRWKARQNRNAWPPTNQLYTGHMNRGIGRPNTSRPTHWLMRGNQHMPSTSTTGSKRMHSAPPSMNSSGTGVWSRRHMRRATKNSTTHGIVTAMVKIVCPTALMWMPDGGWAIGDRSGTARSLTKVALSLRNLTPLGCQRLQSNGERLSPPAGGEPVAWRRRSGGACGRGQAQDTTDLAAQDARGGAEDHRQGGPRRPQHPPAGDRAE